jgi:hypothetical protein
MAQCRVSDTTLSILIKMLAAPGFMSPDLPLKITIDPRIRDEEVPLLHSERTQQRIQRTPFPWFQFFTLQTAEYLPLNTTHPFIPDVRLP